jgi:hypothetical protein
MSVPNPIATIRHTHLFLWNLCVGYSKEFPDPKRPIRGELVAAFIVRVVRLLTVDIFAAKILKTINCPCRFAASTPV